MTSSKNVVGGNLGNDVRAPRHAVALCILATVLLARLALSVLVAARPDLALQPDSDRYVPIANALLEGRAYAWNTDRPGELLNTVGYPLFLAGVYALLGHAAADVALAQLIISGVMVLVLYLYLTRVVGSLPALISALLLALDPLTILWSLTILTELLFAVLLGISAVLISRWAMSGNSRTLLMSGLFVGLACLVRPLAQPVAISWAVALLFFSGHQGRRGGVAAGRLMPVLLLIGPAVVLIAPWVVRNSLLWNCPTLSSVDRVTLRDYMAAKVISEYEHVTLPEVQAQLQEQDPDVCPRRSNYYLQIILTHPDIYAKLHVAGTIPVLIGTSFDRWLQLLGINYVLPDLWRPYLDGGFGKVAEVLGDQFTGSPGAVLFMGGLTGYQVLIYVLAVIGILSFRKAPNPAAKWNIIITVVAVLILVLTPGEVGHERFRVPAQPLMLILVGYGIGWNVVPFLTHRPSRRTTQTLS